MRVHLDAQTQHPKRQFLSLVSCSADLFQVNGRAALVDVNHREFEERIALCLPMGGKAVMRLKLISNAIFDEFAVVVMHFDTMQTPDARRLHFVRDAMRAVAGEPNKSEAENAHRDRAIDDTVRKCRFVDGQHE